jgi:hypothetical protein
MAKNRISKHNFFHYYSLSMVALGILVLWIGLYSISSPSNHLGSFFRNAIADWTAVGVRRAGVRGLRTPAGSACGITP